MRWQGGEVGRRQKEYYTLRKNSFNGKIILSNAGYKANRRLRAKRELLPKLPVWLRSKFDKVPLEGFKFSYHSILYF